MTLTEQLDKHGLKYDENYDTSLMSSIRAGGRAKYVVYPKTTDEFILTIKLVKVYSDRFKVIGGFTNTFFSDEGYDGVIISTSGVSEIKANGSSFFLQTGASLVSAIKTASSCGIDLGAGLFGIPGTVGGAIRNNAGAFDHAISSIFCYGSFYDYENDKVITLSVEELDFGYRTSVMQKESLVFLQGTFKGKSGDSRQIIDEHNNILKIRRERHPKQPSLGSFFKRCGDVIPAKLIDDCGLKGVRLGNAAISQAHAGFIVNLGGATATEIDSLATDVQKKIYEVYGFELIREAEFVK